MYHKPKKSSWIKRFLRWFFGAPVQELPPEFGDPVPPELRTFEVQAEESQHHARSNISAQSPIHHQKSKPVRQDESLERE
jgi:hypothetical protein